MNQENVPDIVPAPTQNDAIERSILDRLIPYVEKALSDIFECSGSDYSCNTTGTIQNPEATARSIFGILRSRKFCYLSKCRSEGYWPGIKPWMVNAAALRSPLGFYLDLGAGYHASLDPNNLPVTFDVGLGELLVLRQMCRFRHLVSGIYEWGIRFTIVIDNLCALLINDIPLNQTELYCARLRELIRQMKLSDWIDVLVESEETELEELKSACKGTAREDVDISNSSIHNVSRFLGRTCSRSEAIKRLIIHDQVIEASERLLDPLIQGVHLTQRASSNTMAFRAHPGADSRC